MTHDVTPASATDRPKAGRRAWLGLAALALPTLLVSLDLSVLHLALPHLTADLAASSTQQLWILDVYGFMVAGFLVTMGTLGDRVGRRKVLLIGAGAFCLLSVVAAYSTSAEALIAARALLGVAGATLMPSTLSLISVMFPEGKQRNIAIATWMSCFMGGTAIGPIVGGALLEWFWWGSVFLLGVPVMLVLLVAGPLLLPEFRAPRTGRLDLASVAMSLVAVLAVVFGLKELARQGVTAMPATILVGGLVIAWLFVRRQRRLDDPLLDLTLFHDRTFRGAVGMGFAAAVVMSGTFLFVPMYLQLVSGLTPLKAGLWLLPTSLAMIASSQVTPHVAGRYRPATIMAWGFGIAAVGAALLTQVDGSPLPLALVVGFALACVGVAPPSAVGTGLVISSAPPERAGSASAMSETSGELGIGLGLAVMGSVGAAVYRGMMADAVPSDVPAQAADVARESIAGAASVIGSLPAETGAVVLEQAREAFTTGLNVVAVVGAVVFLCLAVASVILFRHLPAPRRAVEQPSPATTTKDAGTPAGTPASLGEPVAAAAGD